MNTKLNKLGKISVGLVLRFNLVPNIDMKDPNLWAWDINY